MLSYRGNLLQSIRLCPFWARPTFMLMDKHNLTSCVMLNVFNSPAHLFLSFCLSLLGLHQLQRLSQLQEASPLQVALPDVVTVTNATPLH